MSTNEHDEVLSNRTTEGRWNVEFPFEWDADDLISRRQLLRWSVWVSGALFASTGLLAALSFTRQRRRGGLAAIANAADIPVGEAHYFSYPGPEDQAVLVHLREGRFVAFSNKCTHLSCAVYWSRERGRLVCPCHDGVFHPETGDVLAGPPPRPLPKIELREENGTIYAVSENLT